jgi:limonene-1,2-epoxide hydrolase
MTPEQIVTTVINALERKDLDAACSLMTDDVEYDNVPIGKVVGPAAVASTLGPFFGMCGQIEWVVLHQAASGDVVMNERLDRFEMGGRWVELAVAGVWVVRDGKVALWRDYFDLGAFQAMMAPPA